MSRRAKHKREPLTKDESNRLMRSCKVEKERLVIWTLLDTGLRVNEFCGLTPSMIDWQKHMMLIMGKNTSIVPTKFGEVKEKKARLVPLTARVQGLLELFFRFNDKIGFTTRTAQNVVTRVANRAMLSRKCSPHILRHTFAVDTLQAGVSLPALQRILGHEDLETTAIYLNLGNESANTEFINKVGGFQEESYLKEWREKMDTVKPDFLPVSGGLR
jgi:integrase/recombinase XerD